MVAIGAVQFNLKNALNVGNLNFDESIANALPVVFKASAFAGWVLVGYADNTGKNIGLQGTGITGKMTCYVLEYVLFCACNCCLGVEVMVRLGAGGLCC